MLQERLSDLSVLCVEQWCLNRGPQGPLEWPAKLFSLERKVNTLII